MACTSQERTLDIAFWLDIWCGWRGDNNHGRYYQARDALKACA